MKKQHAQTITSSSKNDLRTNEKKIPLWKDPSSLMKKYGMTILYIILFLIALIFAGYRFSAGRVEKSQRDYYNASELVSQIKDSPNDLSLLNDLHDIIAKHPHLANTYAAPVAQAYLENGDVETAKQLFSLKTPSSNDEISKLYESYTETSFLIAEQQFSQALARALSLKKEMLDKNLFSSEENYESSANALFAHNLLRIAIINQVLNDKKSEKDAWNDFKKYAHADDSSFLHPTFNMLSESFREGDISLFDYVTAREKTL